MCTSGGPLHDDEAVRSRCRVTRPDAGHVFVGVRRLALALKPLVPPHRPQPPPCVGEPARIAVTIVRPSDPKRPAAHILPPRGPRYLRGDRAASFADLALFAETTSEASLRSGLRDYGERCGGRCARRLRLKPGKPVKVIPQGGPRITNAEMIRASPTMKWPNPLPSAVSLKPPILTQRTQVWPGAATRRYDSCRWLRAAGHRDGSARRGPGPCPAPVRW